MNNSVLITRRSLVQIQPPQPFLRDTKQKGLPHQEQPLFSGKLDLFTTRRSSTDPATNLIDSQGLPESRREALPTLGTNLGQKSIFSLRSGVPNNSPNFPVASCSPYPKVCPRERCNWPIQTKINSAAKSCSCVIEVGIGAA